MPPIQTRPRRLRVNNTIRKITAETRVLPENLIMPIFAVDGENIKEPIKSMPGIFHFSADLAVDEAAQIYKEGVKSILIFGIPSKKDERGSEAYNPDGIVQRTIKKIKEKTPDLLVITDVCLCSYTANGHCGITDDNGRIVNDSSIELIAEAALSHAKAGADIVAPSDMMDGRVHAIRTKLDSHGFHDVSILSYAAKYASCFYGPFRDAADCAPAFGDRRTYQMDPPNVREALKEIALDIDEGADIVMVKPAMPYLDVISKAKEKFLVPVAAYQVSGEFGMIKATAKNGWLDEKRAVIETLTSIKRAGADLIITYFAKEYAKILPFC